MIFRFNRGTWQRSERVARNKRQVTKFRIDQWGTGSLANRLSDSLIVCLRSLAKSFINTGISRFYRPPVGECHLCHSCWIFRSPYSAFQPRCLHLYNPFSLSLSLSASQPVPRSVNTTNPPAIKHRLARSRSSFLAFFSSLALFPLSLFLFFNLSPSLCPATTNSAQLPPNLLTPISPPTLSTLRPTLFRSTRSLFLLFRNLGVCTYPRATPYGSRPVAQQRIINYRRPAARVHPNFPQPSSSPHFFHRFSPFLLYLYIFIYFSVSLIGFVENTAAVNSSEINKKGKKRHFEMVEKGRGPCVGQCRLNPGRRETSAFFQ